MIPSDAAIMTGEYHGAPLRILDNCTIRGTRVLVLLNEKEALYA